MAKKNIQMNFAGLFEKNTLKRIIIYLIVAFIVNYFIFYLINSLDPVHYQSSDDFALQNLVNGSLGGYYYDLPAMNNLFLKIVAGFYNVTNVVNWYGAGMLFLLLLSASFTGMVIMDKYGIKRGFLIYLLTVPVYFGLFLTQFQFTLISYSLLIAALAGALHAFFTENRRLKIFLYVFSLCMFLISVLIRSEVIMPTAAYLAICVIFLFIYFRKKAFKFVYVIIAFVFVWGGATISQNSYYASSDELNDFFAFNEARVQLVDRAPLAYDSHADTFASLGWTRNDTDLFRGYTYPDDEKFSTQNLIQIIEARQNIRYMTDMNAVVSNLFSTFTDSNVYMLLLLFVSFFVAFLSGKRKLFSVFLLLLPFLIQAALAVIWRPAFRAVYPHYIVSIVLLMVITDFGALKDKMGRLSLSVREKFNLMRIAAVCMAAVCGVAAANLALNTKWAGDARRSDPLTQYRRDALDYFDENKGNVYLYAVTSPLVSLNESYSIFETFPKDYFIHNRMLGGWDTRSPSYNDFKERNGLVGLPRDMLNENVYYVSSGNVEQMTQYFNETYGLPVAYRIVDLIGGQIYILKIEITDLDHMGQIQ